MNRSLSFFLIGIWVCLSISASDMVNAESKTVAVIWEGRSAMVDAVMQGFTRKMAEIAPDVVIKTYPELAHIKEAEEKFRQSETQAHGIVFLRSSGAEFLATVNPKVPCFVGSCNNPEELGVVKNLKAPAGAITGVTYYIPYEQKFDVITNLFPNVKSVGLLVEAGHPSGPIEQKGTRDECARRGIAYHEVQASTVDQLIKGAQGLVGKVDLFIITNTRLVMDNVTSILSVSNPAKIPIFSYTEHSVKRGAVAGMAADDNKLGSMLADSVVDVVVRGLPVSKVPVKMDDSPRIVVNDEMMKVFGISIPGAMAKQVVPLR